MAHHEVIYTESAPKAVGPYSQAITYNGMVYTAGQVAIDPPTYKLIEGDVAAQTHRVFANLKAVLAAAGTDLDKVVKTTVFLTTMDNFAAMNAVYAEYFSGVFPARSTVAVSQLPLGASVEIECVAYT